MFEIRHRPRSKSLLALALVPAALLAACSESHRSPTEPEMTTAAATAPSQAAAAATILPGKGGRGGGGGNGGGGNGGGGNGGQTYTVQAQVQPDVWNTNWAHSQGTVSVMITGTGLDKIDLKSITLGAKTGGTPVAAQRAQLSGNHVRAFFSQSDAIGSLDHPKTGTTVEVQIQLTQDGQSKTLTDRVRIVGPGTGGGGDDGETELELEIQPDSWNTNWDHSNGTVTALIQGNDLSKVDLKSIVLIGTDTAAAPLPAQRAQKSGNHIRAYFRQADAIKTLDTPKAGERHKITIELSVDGTKTDLTDQIRVVGPGR